MVKEAARELFINVVSQQEKVAQALVGDFPKCAGIRFHCAEVLPKTRFDGGGDEGDETARTEKRASSLLLQMLLTV